MGFRPLDGHGACPIPAHPHPRLRSRTIALLLFVAVLAAGAPVVAQTQDDVNDARQRRDEVRNQANEIAAGIDALTAEADDLVTDLALLDVKIAAIESRSVAADQAVSSTETDLRLVEADIAALEAQGATLRAALVDTLVEQYIDGHAREQRSVLTADDPTGWAMKQGLVNLITADVTTTHDQLRVVQEELEGAQEEAAELHAAAAAERDIAAALAADAAAALEAQRELLDEVSRRLDRRLGEAEALATLDAELSEEIRRGEEEIARRVAVARAKANLEAHDTGDGSSIADRIARPDDIANVRGIDIHHSVADQLLGLINAAEAAGIILGGGGWRSTERQIELRMQNCGTTDYLIFDAPSEACRPPTARPASSNHEAGLAVDFTANGRAIVDRNSEAFLWLAANAPTYGFYNLWSEPWHWSTDGR